MGGSVDILLFLPSYPFNDDWKIIFRSNRQKLFVDSQLNFIRNPHNKLTTCSAPNTAEHAVGTPDTVIMRCKLL